MLNKKALLGAVATVIVACSALFFMKAGSKQDALFEENVEALATSEYSLYGHCRHQSGQCDIKCPHCGVDLGTILAPQKGPAYNVTGTCPQCHGSINIQ